MLPFTLIGSSKSYKQQNREDVVLSVVIKPKLFTEHTTCYVIQ